MPTVKAGAKVLVTGANGYIAFWIVRKLLEQGYSVRATVRSVSKGAYLTDYFKSYGDKLELAVVPDFTQAGAFDEAVKGVDAIEHTASPSHWKATTAKEIIEPAVNGTLGVLKSAQQYGHDVKRIVITSSMATVSQMSDPNGTFYSDKSWNDESVRIVEEQGDKSHPRDLYCASKTLAEKAAWDFHKQHKDTLGWDLTVLNVPWVFGPPIQEVSSPAGLNESMKLWWGITIAPLPDSLDTQQFLGSASPWADVRDVAEAHVLSLEKEAAGGERIIVTSGLYTWHEWVDIANALDPSLLPNGKAAAPLPKTDNMRSHEYDAEKVNRILGIKWISKEQTAKDIMEDAVKRGW